MIPDSLLTFNLSDPPTLILSSWLLILLCLLLWNAYLAYLNEATNDSDPDEKLNNFYFSLFKGDMNTWIQEEQYLRNKFVSIPLIIGGFDNINNLSPTINLTIT